MRVSVARNKIDLGYNQLDGRICLSDGTDGCGYSAERCGCYGLWRCKMTIEVAWVAWLILKD